MNGLFGFFVKRSEVPIEKRNYGMVYLVLSALLFLGTMWSVLDEVTTRRPWKEFQDEYFTLSQRKWEERLKEAEANFDSAAYKEIDVQVKEAEEKINSPEVVQMIKAVSDLDEELVDVTRDYTFAKSRGDEAYYFWKKSLHEEKEDKSYERELREKEAIMAEANTRIEALSARRDSIQSMINGYRNAVMAVRARTKEL